MFNRGSPLLLALVTLLGAASCKQSGAATADSATPGAGNAAPVEANAGARKDSLSLPVVAATARDGDLVLRVNTTGLVRSDAIVRLAAEVGGVVATVPMRAGATVRRGEAVARLDPFLFELAVREAQAKLEEAEQRYLESYVPESLVTLRAPTAEQRRVFAIRAGLAAARFALARAEREQSGAVVTSPIDGVLDAVLVSVGERLTAGQAVATVVDTRNLRVEAQVLEHDLGLLHTGGEAFVTSAGAPGRELHGRIEAILPLVDSVTRSGRAIVRLTGEGTLRPGMYADVQLESARLARRRLVPARAVIERDGRPLVFVVREGRAQWTYIVPGRSNGVDTEVLADSVSGIIPVTAGDTVIVDGHLTLTHDAPVRVTAFRTGSAPATGSARDSGGASPVRK